LTVDAPFRKWGCVTHWATAVSPHVGRMPGGPHTRSVGNQQIESVLVPRSRAMALPKRLDNPETGERARVLDLFCCAGGAALGIRQAFDAIGRRVEIVGVDIKPRPRYPFRFVLGDALEHARRAGEFDFVWASPPCQRYSVATPQAARRRHPDLVARTRDLLLAAGVPFVIENVPGAPLIDPVVLCGSMFEPDRNILWDYVQCTHRDDSDDTLLTRMLSGTQGRRMQVRRHRLFEAHGFAVRRMACEHSLSAPAIEVAGGLGRHNSDAHRKAWHAWMAKAALGIPAWHPMSGKETTQCVPPAYAKYILSEFLLNGRLSAVSSPSDDDGIVAIERLDCTTMVQSPDPETVAKALSDSELVEKCVQGFRDLREAIPYLREARDRFAQPGRRVPVPGTGQPDVDGVGADQPARHRAACAAAIERGGGTSRNNFARFQAAAEAALRGLARFPRSNGTQGGAGLRHD
jgi:DNA (cytosine-5)-methyltransferase 1